MEHFLLNVEKNGYIQCTTFIVEFEADISRFEKSIRKIPLLNLSQDYLKKQVQEVRIERNLFGRMLGIFIDHKGDIANILSCPVTPVPLSMCHFDDAIC